MRTLRPTRHRLAIAATAGVLALALTGCGGDDSNDGSGGGTSASDTPSEDDLQAALLTADDLPDGYEEAEDDSDDNSDVFDGTCFADVSDALDALDEGEADDDVNAEQYFELPPDGDSSITVSAGYVADTSEFDDKLAQVKSILDSCTQVNTTTEDGVTLDLQLATSEDPGVTEADSALGFSLTGTVSGQGQELAIGVHAVVALEGPTGASVLSSALGDGAADDVTPDLASAQLEKLADFR